MKVLFTIIILTSFTTLFGQKLKFDVMAQYTVSNKNHTFESSAYAISSNDNYMLKILNQPSGIQNAFVYDLKKIKKHEYKIIEIKSENNEVNYKFVYINTYDLADIEIKSSYKFKSVSVENNVETVKLFIYKSTSKGKINTISELKILKSDANLFPLFRFICLHTSEFDTEFNYTNTGLVTSCVFENGLGQFTLKTFEEANLEISLPE